MTPKIKKDRMVACARMIVRNIEHRITNYEVEIPTLRSQLHREEKEDWGAAFTEMKILTFEVHCGAVIVRFSFPIRLDGCLKGGFEER